MSFRFRAAVPLSACVLALGACGVVTSPSQVAPQDYIEEPAISSAAVTAFGQERVEEAHEELTAFALERAFPEEFLDPQKDTYTHEELAAGVQNYLTKDMADAWSALVVSALAGDTAAQESLRVLQFYHLDDPTSALPPDHSPPSNQQIMDSRIDIERTATGPGVQLVITWKHIATLELVDVAAGAEERYALDVTKTMKFWLTPSTTSSGPRWLITQYDGSYTVDVPEA
ncbi:hypothetical protein [Georgenia sp. AZ-5]|uniref:hypothetical protein n=1 Tax=Georgenia sp. AZ-5 TaxID=3367526 RepID=UPI003754339D